ncbi:hypothetical protein BDR05DRAFT_947638 [Suillus weaverae]|nr:hypothetical protein BDR05DRAFT_947638 [Suillus weaverae]
MAEDCSKNWKATVGDEKKCMWAIFEETGIFVAVCHHGFILCTKYPLAIISKVLEVLGECTCFKTCWRIVRYKSKLKELKVLECSERGSNGWGVGYIAEVSILNKCICCGDPISLSSCGYGVAWSGAQGGATVHFPLNITLNDSKEQKVPVGIHTV